MDASRERDQAVERLLRQSRQGRHLPPHGGVTDACLDAETAAAWIDNGLSGAALEMAQAHVADCARCQALLGTLSRVNINALDPQAKPERDSRRWIAWFVPLTAAAAAVALWVAVPRDGSDRQPVSTEVRKEAAQTKALEPETRDDRAPAPASERRTASGNTQEQAAKRDAGASNQVRERAPEFRTDTLSTSAFAPSAPPAPAASADESRPRSTPPTPAKAALAKPSAVPESVGGLAQSAAPVSEVAATEIVSPDQSVRWRIAGSVVQRSTSGGSTWDAVPTGIAAALTAGAAPSASVCWLVGRGGVVLLTTDGRTWRRVAFPEMTDLSGVQATDARVASVSTADGRTFNTTDGGVTWIRRPLQEF